MSSLPQQLEAALRDLLAKLPDAIKSKNFEQLAADAKQHVYRIIAETLLAQDHPTVAAALLDALRDDTIAPEEWRGVLKAWARELAGSDPLAVDVVSAFDDDVLSKEEAINLAIKWVKREVTDPSVAEFLDAATTFFHTGAPEALERVLANVGLPDAVARAISQAIATGTVTAQQVYQMVAAWVAASGEEELARLIERLPDAKPEEIILAAIGERLPDEIKTIVEKLLAGDWNGLFAAVLGALHLSLGERVLTKIANGKFREAAIEEIVDLLTQAGVKQAHAGPLVNAAIDLATGARSLFASGPEADAPELKTPAMVVLWREIRRVIYMAQLDSRGGQLVPTNPQARPHVFVAAGIRYTTPPDRLVPPNASKQEREEFCHTLTAFLDAQFGSRMARRFLDDRVLVIAPDELLPGSDAICGDIFIKVGKRLK